MPLPRPSAFLANITLAVLVLALAEAEFAAGEITGPIWLGVAGGIVLSVPLLWVRRQPWPVLIVVFAVIVATRLLSLEQRNFLDEQVAGTVAVYGLANQVPLRQALAGLAYALVMVALSAIQQGVFNYGWAWLFLGATFLAARAMRSRRILIEQLRATTRDLAVSRDENAQAAVAAERVRIARELHDVVAHAVGVIVVQAGGAERMVEADPPRARRSMVAIQDAGRQALTELRSMLEVLRPDDPARATLTPQPGLADLDELAGSLRTAGLAIRLSREGEARTLPSGLDLAAYRIVQEALTNVLKHANTTTAEVAVRYRHDGVEVEIIDDGPGPAGQDHTARTRHGLIGMRERAALYGGDFDAGPRQEGGYAVRATLPSAAMAVER